MQTDTNQARISVWPGVAGSILLLTSCAPKDIFNEEPPLGTLKVGEVVLVDDGSCPDGQIKEVTAGNRALLIDRTRRCIDR